jgi:hypothetical protein
MTGKGTLVPLTEGYSGHSCDYERPWEFLICIVFIATKQEKDEAEGRRWVEVAGRNHYSAVTATSWNKWKWRSLLHLQWCVVSKSYYYLGPNGRKSLARHSKWKQMHQMLCLWLDTQSLQPGACGDVTVVQIHPSIHPWFRKYISVTQDWRKMLNGELHYLYSSPNITTMIK